MKTQVSNDTRIARNYLDGLTFIGTLWLDSSGTLRRCLISCPLSEWLEVREEINPLLGVVEVGFR